MMPHVWRNAVDVLSKSKIMHELRNLCKSTASSMHQFAAKIIRFLGKSENHPVQTYSPNTRSHKARYTTNDTHAAFHKCKH